MEKDWSWLSSDDLMASTSSNQQGKFRIDGVEEEIVKISPYLEVVHPCDHLVVSERPHTANPSGILEVLINKFIKFRFSVI